jgi:uncharacterized protein YcbK (DUF882 family)
MPHACTRHERSGEIRVPFGAPSASSGWVAVAVLLLALPVAGPARADHEHTVVRGQTLARIASRYHVPVTSLAAANGLSRQAALRTGQVLVVPERGVVYVSRGDTLAGLSRRYEVSAADLARVNRLKESAPLRIGQRLMLPGFETARAAEQAEKRWGRTKHPGVVIVHRLATQTTQRVQVLDRRGRLREPALREMSVLLRQRGSRKSLQPHPRLVRLLARVSDHFGGRPIHVVSGYRKPGGFTRDTSRHVAGEAVDFRIPGVPIEALRDYCQTFEHVGVGYYPRSKFVHLDVRRKNARWTDLSGPGEAPRVARPGEAGGPLVLGRGAAVAPGGDGMADEPAAEDDGQPPIDDPEDAQPK